MQITDILARMGGFQSIARELGISEAEAASGAAALTPAIVGGVQKQVEIQPAGPSGLPGLLGSLGGGSLLEDVLSARPTDVNRGNGVLGQIFGSKDVSRAVAQDASAKSGLSPEILKRMLPMVAMLVAGYLAKQNAARAGQPSATGDGPGGLLSKVLGRRTTGSEIPGAESLLSMVGVEGDRNPLDDILQAVGKATH